MLVLASQSPRRAELLRNAGIPFVVRAAPVDESTIAGETPAEYVKRLACAKAHAVAAAPHEIVLGADTTVVVDGEILAKPEDAADARRMLKLLSGRQHDVLTGICLKRGSSAMVEHTLTIVRFAPMTDAEIEEYVASGEPVDKAGAYGIQGRASKFVASIEGCFFNVVGLPVPVVYRRLMELQNRQVTEQ